MRTIPKISARKKDMIAYNHVFKQAAESNKVSMVISERNFYSNIVYDLKSVYPFVTLSDIHSEKIIRMYEDYAKRSKMNKKYFQYVGGSRNLLLTVKRNDAEKFANKILKFIEKNLVSVSCKWKTKFKILMTL